MFKEVYVMTQYEKILQMWRSFNIKTVADLDMRLDSFKVLFAYNSGKIENSEVTYEDTREVFSDDRVSSFSGKPTTITEISNQRKCYKFLLPQIISAEPLTLELIKEVHDITTMATYDDRCYFELGERPGSFKKTDFVVGINEIGATPEEVESELKSLLEELHNEKNYMEPAQILRTASYFHVWFETIHPFADGNGRVGRTLMNYMLMSNNHPPLVVYNDDKKVYYSALDYFREGEDLQPFFEFSQKQLEKTWHKTLECMEKRKQ